MATLCGKFSSGFVHLHRLNSHLFRGLVKTKCIPAGKDACVTIVKRGMAGGHNPKKFFIQAPDYADNQFVRTVVRYLSYTGVPALILVTYVNVFIGPAQLAEIPEGYEPKHWEYHQHPISRFIAKYFHASPQQDYEKMAHFVEMEQQATLDREELVRVKRIMKEKSDGVWSHVPAAPPPFKEEN